VENNAFEKRKWTLEAKWWLGRGHNSQKEKEKESAARVCLREVRTL